MGGWEEEAFFAAFRVGELTQQLGEDPTADYLNAYNMRRTRAEPLHRLANYYLGEKVRKFELAYLFAKQAAGIPMAQGDCFFVDVDVYTWRCWEVLGLACHWSGRKEEAVEVARRLKTIVPEWARPWADTFFEASCRGLVL